MLELPEEILDRIVHLALPHPDDPAFLSPPCPTRPSSILHILLISRKFLRIATPHVYNTIRLITHSQAQLLLSSLHNNPSLAPHVQSLTILGVWPEAGLIMGLCKGAVRRLEIALELFDEYGPPVDREYGDGLRELVGVRHLIVRKPYHVYLSLPKLRYIMIALANAIKGWIELETVNIAFKLSDDTPTSPVLSSTPVFSSFSLAYIPHIPTTTTAANPPLLHNSIGPTTQLANALAHAPNLHTFTTHLPSVWNLAILTISSNPQLERIILSETSSSSNQTRYQIRPLPHTDSLASDALRGAVLNSPSWHISPYSPSPATVRTCRETGLGGTGLFLMEARRHPRLSNLILAGREAVTRGKVALEEAGGGDEDEDEGATLSSRCQGLGFGWG